MMNRFQQVSVGEKDPDLASSLQVGMMFSAIWFHISRRALVDLVFTMGFYHQISMTLNAFNVPLPDGVEAIFKEPTFPEWDGSDDV